MALLTDPANELAQLAAQLTGTSNKVGWLHLANKFSVDNYSTEFYALILTIAERADIVARAIQRCDWDNPQKSSALEDIGGFKSAFTPGVLNQNWGPNSPGPRLMRDHGRVLTYMSATVRQQVSYPQFTPEERSELLLLIEQYVIDLENEKDLDSVVRGAIVESITRFRFALEHLEWGGANYTLEAFRELTGAYAWIRNEDNFSAEFDSNAALRGLLSLIRLAKEKIDSAQAWADSGNSVYRAYNLATNVITPLMITHQATGS